MPASFLLMDILAHTATAVTLRVGRCRGAAGPFVIMTLVAL
jgi:hypothetical protein